MQEHTRIDFGSISTYAPWKPIPLYCRILSIPLSHTHTACAPGSGTSLNTSSGTYVERPALASIVLVAVAPSSAALHARSKATLPPSPVPCSIFICHIEKYLPLTPLYWISSQKVPGTVHAGVIAHKTVRCLDVAAARKLTGMARHVYSAISAKVNHLSGLHLRGPAVLGSGHLTWSGPPSVLASTSAEPGSPGQMRRPRPALRGPGPLSLHSSHEEPLRKVSCDSALSPAVHSLIGPDSIRSSACAQMVRCS